jgi:hypothetical protein
MQREDLRLEFRVSFFNNLQRNDLRLEVRVSFFNNLQRDYLRLEIRVFFITYSSLPYPSTSHPIPSQFPSSVYPSIHATPATVVCYCVISVTFIPPSSRIYRCRRWHLRWRPSWRHYSALLPIKIYHYKINNIHRISKTLNNYAVCDDSALNNTTI